MASVPELAQLKQIPLFEGLTDAELTRLGALLRCRTVGRGKSIITAEQPGEAAYLIFKGTVKIRVESAEGNEVILALLGAGEVVGEMSVVDSLARSATVVTIEDSEICWIDRASFSRCIDDIPAMSHNLIRIIARRLRLANSQIQALSTLDVYGRVARQLLTFADEYGLPAGNGDVTIPVRLTQSDLAALIGATRVRVNQVLVDLKQHNYLSVDRYFRITIHDRAALARHFE